MSKEVTGVADVENAAEGEDTSLVYVLSAKDSAVAQQLNKNLAEYLRQAKAAGKEPSPTDLAFTLAERKSRFPWVTAIRAKGLGELADRLDDPDRKASRATKVPRVGFVFNGQGAQWYAMGRELIEGYPVFRRSLLAADKILKDYGAPWSLHGMTLPVSFPRVSPILRRVHQLTSTRGAAARRKDNPRARDLFEPAAQRGPSAVPGRPARVLGHHSVGRNKSLQR